MIRYLFCTQEYNLDLQTPKIQGTILCYVVKVNRKRVTLIIIFKNFYCTYNFRKFRNLKCNLMITHLCI